MASTVGFFAADLKSTFWKKAERVRECMPMTARATDELAAFVNCANVQELSGVSEPVGQREEM